MLLARRRHSSPPSHACQSAGVQGDKSTDLESVLLHSPSRAVPASMVLTRKKPPQSHCRTAAQTGLFRLPRKECVSRE